MAGPEGFRQLTYITKIFTYLVIGSIAQYAISVVTINRLPTYSDYYAELGLYCNVAAFGTHELMNADGQYSYIMYSFEERGQFTGVISWKWISIEQHLAILSANYEFNSLPSRVDISSFPNLILRAPQRGDLPEWTGIKYFTSNISSMGSHDGYLEVRSGIPFKSLNFSLGCSNTGVYTELLSHGFVISPGAILNRECIVPISILWVGFALNSILFAAGIYLPTIINAGLRFFIRTIHNQCPKCGYPQKGLISKGCPECGWKRNGLG